MRRWSITSALAVAVVAVIAVAGCGSSGSSSSGLSGWSSSDTEKVESEVANTLTEQGLTPTKAETGCIVAGLQRMDVSASRVLENGETTLDQEREIHEITEECVTSSSGSEESESGSGESQEEIAAEAEETLSGPACQEDIYSEACREEATQKENEIAEKEGLTPPEE